MAYKKQACVALSTAEAEDIAAGSCCAQILWLKQQLAYFGLQISKVPFVRMYGFKLEGGEWFKEGFHKLLSLE